jgi:hypothetical protein
MSFKGKIPNPVLAAAPLYDPDPSTWDPKLVVTTKPHLYRCHLSDFAAVAFLVLVEAGYLARGEVERFEVTYGSNARIRTGYRHQGRPALAPDGTVMRANVGIGYPNLEEFDGGQTGLPVRRTPWIPWTPGTVRNCPGYDKWLADLKHGVGVGGPFPTEAELDTLDAAWTSWGGINDV